MVAVTKDHMGMYSLFDEIRVQEEQLARVLWSSQ